mgnify:CR=1 FL=1
MEINPPLGDSARIEELETFNGADLADLCDITADAIVDGEGFLWVDVPRQKVLENYWHGVLLVPERSLFAARLDGRIVGTAQLFHPSPNNESGAFGAQLTTFFVAPRARGRGLARAMMQRMIDAAMARQYTTLDLDVRADRAAAIALFEAYGFTCWGERPRYARVRGKYLAGRYYTKFLDAA